MSEHDNENNATGNDDAGVDRGAFENVPTEPADAGREDPDLQRSQDREISADPHGDPPHEMGEPGIRP